MCDSYVTITKSLDELFGKNIKNRILTSEENQLIYRYINCVNQQYGFQDQSQKRVFQINNKTSSVSTNKKKVIIKTPTNAHIHANSFRYKTSESQNSPDRKSYPISSLKSNSKCSPSNNKSSSTHGRTNSAFMVSINGKKQISLQRTLCSTKKAINFRNLDFEQPQKDSEIKVTEFNASQSQFENNLRDTNFKKAKKSKICSNNFRMCFGCQQYIQEDAISEHEQECDKIAGLYELSSQQLLSETQSKLSIKKELILNKFQKSEDKQIQNLYENIRKYLQNQIMEDQEPQTIKQIQKQSHEVMECLGQFHKLTKYRKIKSALAFYSDPQ